jgi:hypothetical protein
MGENTSGKLKIRLTQVQGKEWIKMEHDYNGIDLSWKENMSAGITAVEPLYLSEKTGQPYNVNVR